MGDIGGDISDDDVPDSGEADEDQQKEDEDFVANSSWLSVMGQTCIS